MRLLRIIFQEKTRVFGSDYLTSIDVNPGQVDAHFFTLELVPAEQTVKIHCIAGKLKGQTFGVPMSRCSWEYAPAEKPAETKPAKK